MFLSEGKTYSEIDRLEEKIEQLLSVVQMLLLKK